MDSPIALFKSAWQTYKSNWRILSLVIVAPFILIQLSQILSLFKNLPLSLLGLLLLIGACIVGIAMPATFALTVKKIDEGQKEFRIKDQYKLGMAFFWGFVLISIIRTFATGGAFILLAIPAIILSVYTAFFIFTYVFDGKKGISAFIESYLLVKGHFWAVFGRLLFVVLVNFVLLFIAGRIQYGINYLFAFPKDAIGSYVVSAIILLILTAIIASVSVIYVYRMYENLKRIRTTGGYSPGFKKVIVTLIVIGILASITIPFLIAGYVAKHPDLFINEEVLKCNNDEDCIKAYMATPACQERPELCLSGKIQRLILEEAARSAKQ